MPNAISKSGTSPRCGSRRSGSLAVIAAVSMSVGIGFVPQQTASAASTATKAKPRRTTPPPTLATVAPATLGSTTVAPTTAVPTSSTTLAPTATIAGKTVTFSIDIPLTPGGSVQVPICTSDGLSCVAASYGPSQREVSGALIGQLVQVQSSAAANGRIVTTGFFNYSGAVEGCGVGQFSVRSTIEASATAAFSGVGSTFPWTVAKWEVVSGSGSRGLPDITGGGTMALTLPGPAAARLTYTGRLVCAPLAP